MCQLEPRARAPPYFAALIAEKHENTACKESSRPPGICPYAVFLAVSYLLDHKQ
jgi:hypothetical protein